MSKSLGNVVDPEIIISGGQNSKVCWFLTLVLLNSSLLQLMIVFVS